MLNTLQRNTSIAIVVAGCMGAAVATDAGQLDHVDVFVVGVYVGVPCVQVRASCKFGFAEKELVHHAWS